MRHFKSLFILLFLSLCLDGWSQEVVLVQDYNPGEEDGYDNFNRTSHQIGDDFLIPIFKPEHGVELGILKDGELSLLADINPGEESSEPRNFYSYQGMVYFSCEAKSGEHTIWVTDGTSEGTVQIYDSENPSSFAIRFLEAESGWLYFGYNSEIQRTNGTDFQYVAPFFFGGFSSTVTSKMIPYKEEVAFISEESQMANIYAVNDSGGLDTLLQMDLNFITDVESFISLGDFLLFELDDFQDDDLEGYYHLRPGDAEATKLDLPRAPSRMLKLSDDAMIGTLFNIGVFSFRANDSGIVTNQEFDGWPETFVQGAGMPSVIKQGKALYEGYDNFPDDMLFITDVNTMETTTVIELEPIRSNMISHNNFAFLASGVSNGFEPVIHYYDFKNNAAGVIKSFSERSTNSSSVFMVGVQDSKLYFLSNLFPETGREMYYIDISDLDGLDVSVENEPGVDFTMKFHNKGFELGCNTELEFNYSLYTISGELIYESKGKSNQHYPLVDHQGMIILKVMMDGKEKTYLTPVLR